MHNPIRSDCPSSLAGRIGTSRRHKPVKRTAPVAEVLEIPDMEGRLVTIDLATHEVKAGSAGSVLHELNIPHPPDGILDLAWNWLGTCVCIDAARGYSSYIIPVNVHRDYVTAVNYMIFRFTVQLGLEGSGFLDHCWQVPGMFMESDASFYIGKIASTLNATCQSEGTAAAREFNDRTSPQLLVKVHVPSNEIDKSALYRRLGTIEMRQLNVSEDGKPPEIRILDLQAETGQTD